MSTTAPSNRRSFRRFLAILEPGHNINGKLIVFVLFALPILAMLATYNLVQTMQHLIDVPGQNIERIQPIINELGTVALIFIAIICMLALTAIYCVFFLSVRVFGPQVALLSFIKQLQEGDYRPYRELRKGDELGEIWAALQDLATELRSK